jgi:hypothetical protein
MQQYLISGRLVVEQEVIEWVRSRGIQVLYRHAPKSEHHHAFAVVSFLTAEDEVRWGREFIDWVSTVRRSGYQKWPVLGAESAWHPTREPPQVPIDFERVLP